MHLRRWLLALCLTSPACASLPRGKVGPEADALAHRLEAAVHLTEWQHTGAVRWTFAGRHQHLWDRQRDWVLIRSGDCEVRRHLWSNVGDARCDGKPVDADDLQKQLDGAYAMWVNDAFWLNPLAKLFDPGVTRSLVDTEDGPGLLITYSSGGLTPGDSYLWVPGSDDLPRYWKMWVSILPMKGVRVSWEGWTDLQTGAKISTRHAMPVFTLEVTDLAGAADVVALMGKDPFADVAPPLPAAPSPGPEAGAPGSDAPATGSTPPDK